MHVLVDGAVLRLDLSCVVDLQGVATTMVWIAKRTGLRKHDLALLRTTHIGSEQRPCPVGNALVHRFTDYLRNELPGSNSNMIG